MERKADKEIASIDQKRNYFGTEKKVLKAVGISLDEDESTLFKMYTFLVFIIIEFGYIIMNLYEVFTQDFEVVSNMITYTFGAFSAYGKGLILLINRKQFKQLFEKLEKKPFLPNTKRGGDIEQALNNKCLFIANTQSKSYLLFVSTTMLLSGMMTVVSRLRSNDYHDWETSFGPITFVNTTYSPNFEIFAFLQNLGIFSLSAHFAIADAIISSLLVHMCFQLKMVQNNIKRLIEISYNKMLEAEIRDNGVAPCSSDASEIPWKYLRISLKEVVEYHLEIFSFVEIVAEMLRNLLLLTFLCTLAIQCFLVYHSMKLELADSRLFTLIGQWFCGCLQIFLVCYWGEQLMFESKEVGRITFESNFVGADVRFQKGLLLIIRRSQNIVKITAGKFADVNLATFSWIMRSSYSAFMILQNRKKVN